MAYFTAVVARVGRSWRARDVDVDDAESLDDLADSLRGVAADDQPVLAVVEHEDEWFALVRVDGDDEPRLFVSDLAAASHSRYGDLLAPAADVSAEDDVDEVAADPEDSVEEEDDEEPNPPASKGEPVVPWAGEPDLLDDLGIPGRALRKLVEDSADDPGSVLADIGDTVGFGELLEALR